MPRDPFDLKLKPFAETIFFYSNASKLLKADAEKHCGEKNRAAEKNRGHVIRFCVSHFGHARMFSKQQLS